MPRRPDSSSISGHPRIGEIDAMLARGAKLNEIARRFGVSRFTLARRRSRIVAERPGLVAASLAADWKVDPSKLEALRTESAEGWLSQLRLHYSKLVALFDACIGASELHSAAMASREVRETLTLIGRAVNEIGAATIKINNTMVIGADTWALIEEVMLALKDHPEARAAVVQRVRRFETKQAAGALPVSSVPAPVVIDQPVASQELFT